MKRTAFTLLFYDNTASYHKSYISEGYFEEDNFYYYMRNPGSDILNRMTRLIPTLCEIMYDKMFAPNFYDTFVRIDFSHGYGE